jgi:hypothetical protein
LAGAEVGIDSRPTGDLHPLASGNLLKLFPLWMDAASGLNCAGRGLLVFPKLILSAPLQGSPTIANHKKLPDNAKSGAGFYFSSPNSLCQTGS